MTMPRPSRRLLLCVLIAVCASVAVEAADDRKAGHKSPSTKAATKSHTVTMKDKKYSPAALTIKPGDTVVWKNDDDHDHTAIADDKSFKSGNISPKDSFEFTFKKAGTFAYSCKYHPRMKGTVTVEK